MTPLGGFQRICQASILFSWALGYEADNRENRYSHIADSFFELEAATRRFVEAMLVQPGRSGDYCGGFCMCVRYVPFFYYQIQDLYPRTYGAMAGDVG